MGSVVARPLKWTLANKSRACRAICEQIATGPKSLREICRAPSMPSIWSVLYWLNTDAEFARQYARARELQADYFADEIIEIADTEKDAAKARNRIDARKWMAAKLRPKVYGDRLHVDSDAHITLTDEQLDARIAKLSRELFPTQEPDREPSKAVNGELQRTAANVEF
jgi:hypothetical protein